MNAALQNIVTSELALLGLELFELRSGGTNNRPVVGVRIERKDGEKVTVEDCARASRAIEARLDGASDVSARSVLEVSSPGVERPLRNAADWRRFVGREAVVTAAEGESASLTSREAKIAAVEGEDGEEVIVLEHAKGGTSRIALAAVKKARLAFNWKR
ncbi:MAG: hypothetical protein H0T48_03055 [Gemmatimonadaceae bacterium]|nr:hypothetical protein [Gemmatimonadaceae bacterium]